MDRFRMGSSAACRQGYRVTGLPPKHFLYERFRMDLGYIWEGLGVESDAKVLEYELRFVHKNLF